MSLWIPGGEPAGGDDLTAPDPIDPESLSAGTTSLGSTSIGSWSASVTVTATGVDSEGGEAPEMAVSGSGAGPYSVSIASGLENGGVYLYTITGEGADGQVASVGLAVAVAASAGGLTAPSSVHAVDFTGEESADWSSDTGDTRTVDGAAFDSYGDSAEVFGPDGSTGVVVEALNSGGGTILGPGLELDIQSDASQDRHVVVTWKLTDISLPLTDDYVVCEMLGTTSPARRGPGGGFWLSGSGALYIVTRRASNNSPLTTLKTTLGEVPTDLWVRLVADRCSGLIRVYYSTSAPNSTHLSGGMTFVGVARASGSEAALTTAPDVWPSLWLLQCRLFRTTGGGGSNATMTIATLDVEELTP